MSRLLLLLLISLLVASCHPYEMLTSRRRLISRVAAVALVPQQVLAKSGDSANMGGPAFVPSPFVPTEEGCLVKDMFSDQCLEYEKKAAAYDAAAVASARAQSSVKSLPPIREKLVKLQALVEANKLGQANNEVSNVAGVLVPLVASVDSTKGKNVKTKMFDLATACVKKDQAAAIASIRAVIELVDSL